MPFLYGSTFKLLPDDAVSVRNIVLSPASSAARLARRRGGRTTLARLQQLRSRCNRDCCRLLAGNARDADRAGHRRKARGGHPPPCDPPLERTPLGQRADQAEICVIGAAEDSLGQRFVQPMPASPDEEIR